MISEKNDDMESQAKYDPDCWYLKINKYSGISDDEECFLVETNPDDEETQKCLKTIVKGKNNKETIELLLWQIMEHFAITDFAVSVKQKKD